VKFYPQIRAEWIGNKIGNLCPAIMPLVQESAWKQAFYVLYFIGNKIGTNDPETLRSSIGHGAAPA
jgi:hypothetical protein